MGRYILSWLWGAVSVIFWFLAAMPSLSKSFMKLFATFAVLNSMLLLVIGIVVACWEAENEP